MVCRGEKSEPGGKVWAFCRHVEGHNQNGRSCPDSLGSFLFGIVGDLVIALWSVGPVTIVSWPRSDYLRE